MKFLILFSFLYSLSARADIFVLVEGSLLQVPWEKNALNPSSSSFEQMNFIEFDFDGDVFHFKTSAPSPLTGIKILPKPTKPKLEKLEGCAQYPKEWMRKAQIVGKVEKKDKSKKLWLSLPKEYSAGKDSDEILKSMVRLGYYIDAKEKLPTRVFANEENELAFVLYDNGLNQILAILENSAKKEWKKVSDMTLTDQCP